MTNRNRDQRTICLMVNGLERAGAETQVYRLATGLALRGWRVHLISILQPAAYLDSLIRAGVEVLSLDVISGKPTPGVLLRTVRLLRRIRPSLLITFMYQANLLGRVAGWLAGVPIIISSIRNEYFGGSNVDKEDRSVRAREGWIRRTDRLVRQTVVNSQLVARSLASRGVVPGEKLTVIPNAVPVDEIAAVDVDRQAMRRQLGIGEEDFLWLHVGHMREQKGHGVLLEAFRRLETESQLQRLWLVGEGVLREEVSEKVRQHHLEERVELLGHREDVPVLLQLADALVLASSWEGLPNVLLEAHAAGLPIVSTRVGGVDEIVLDGQSGFLVPPGDPKALTDAMDRLRSLPVKQRRSMGQTGENHVRVRFDTEHVLDAWEELIQSVRGSSSTQ